MRHSRDLTEQAAEVTDRALADRGDPPVFSQVCAEVNDAPRLAKQVQQWIGLGQTGHFTDPEYAKPTPRGETR